MLTHDFGFISELFHQGFQCLPVEFPEGCLVSVHILDKARFTNRIGAERLPLVPALRGIDYDGMGVQLRLLIAVRIVVEFRHNQIAGQYGFAFTVRHDTGRSQGLQLFHGFRHRLVMGINKALIATQHGQHRDTFRRRERQVIARAMFVLSVLHAGQVAAVRQLPFQ